MKKREEKVNESTQYVTAVYYVNGSLYDSYQEVKTYYADAMYGWDNENYHQRRRRGELLPHTPFEQFTVDYSQTGEVFRFTQSGHSNPSWMDGYLPPGRTLNDVYLSRTTLKSLSDTYEVSYLVQAASAKIYENGWDALTFLGELRSTIRTFVSLRRQLINLVRGRGLEESWLSYRYGWRTLYYDMVDFREAVNNLDSKRKRFSEALGYSESYVDTYRDQHVNNSNWTADFVRTTSVEASLRGHVVADVTPPNFRFDPVLTAWELITFSFIIDWFIKVGTWLSSLHFIALQIGYTAAGGVKLDVTRHSELDILASPGGVTSSWSADASADFTWRIPQRVSMLPHISISLDVPRLIDLWALFRRR